MKRAVFAAIMLLSACSSRSEQEKNTASTAPEDSAETDEAVKQEAKSIEAAADEAAALIEAEANGEIRALDNEAGKAEVESLE